MPGVERRESPCRCLSDIQVEMLASTATPSSAAGCRHPTQSNSSSPQWRDSSTRTASLLESPPGG
jgi:hypothetical protein